MSKSNSSSDVNIKMYDDKGPINNNQKSEQKKSSETDYYMNLLANNSKIMSRPQQISDSDIVNSETDDNSSAKSSYSRKSNDSEKSNRSSRSERSNRSDRSNRSTRSNNSEKKSSRIPHHINGGDSMYQNKSQHMNPPIIPSTAYVEPKQLSPQELRMKKIEYLRKLSEIKSKGYSLSKEYDFNSSIEEMEYEYDLLKSFADKRNGLKIYKTILLNGVSVIEFLNDKYDPFDFHLQGWGEHMSVEVDSYDDVLEELYEKYKGTGKSMPPEVKLLLLIVASASAFHFTKSQSSIPGLESILQKNPDMISKIINPQKPQSKFMSEQELNIQKQKEFLQQQNKNAKQSMREPAPSNQSSNKISPAGVVEIKQPLNVQSILNRIKQQQNRTMTETQDESLSNNDRIISENNVSNKKQTKKPLISIATN